MLGRDVYLCVDLIGNRNVSRNAGTLQQSLPHGKVYQLDGRNDFVAADTDLQIYKQQIIVQRYLTKEANESSVILLVNW